MAELPESWRAILVALQNGPLAWRTPAEVAEALERDVEELTDELATLDVAGWIDVWDRPEGPAVTLSAWGAAQLGARLVEGGPDGSPRWRGVGDPEPAQVPARGLARRAALEALDLRVDPLPSPDQAAEAAELAASATGPRPDGSGPLRLPFPSLLLGTTSLNGWSAPKAGTPFASACLVCGARRLLPHEYCLYCDRWGLDSLLFSASRTRVPNPTRKTLAPPADRTQWQRDQEAARLRRKSRHADRMTELRRNDRRRKRAV